MSYCDFTFVPCLLLFVILFIYFYFYVYLFIRFATQPTVKLCACNIVRMSKTDAVRIAWHKVLTLLGEPA